YVCGRGARVGARARRLEYEDHAGDSTAGRYVVRHPQVEGADPTLLEQLRRPLEVHPVALVVAVHEENTVAAMRTLGDFHDRGRRRRREHISEGCTVGEARP